MRPHQHACGCVRACMHVRAHACMCARACTCVHACACVRSAVDGSEIARSDGAVTKLNASLPLTRTVAPMQRLQEHRTARSEAHHTRTRTGGREGAHAVPRARRGSRDSARHAPMRVRWPAGSVLGPHSARLAALRGDAVGARRRHRRRNEPTTGSGDGRERLCGVRAGAMGSPPQGALFYSREDHRRLMARAAPMKAKASDRSIGRDVE